MSNHRYRCVKKECGVRITLSKRIEEYVKEPTCRACGARLRDVEDERRRYIKKTTCACDGIYHPHRKGCKWCNYYEGKYTDEELQERHCM